jgi:hypothetical protein
MRTVSVAIAALHMHDLHIAQAMYVLRTRAVDVQSKQWDAALAWEVRQQERVQVRYKAHEHEKRMTRQGAHQRRKGAHVGHSSAADALTASLGAKAPQKQPGPQQLVEFQGGPGDFGWGFARTQEVCTDLDPAEVPAGWQLGTVLLGHGTDQVLSYKLEERL